jgi:predicted amidophosphoribosyltransferase
VSTAKPAARFNRHITRLCGACGAPMARKEDSCWRCGEQWTEPAGAQAAPGAASAPAGPNRPSDG